MKTLNLVMIVKNEERCLERCLSSVKDLVDDMIIVDTGSNDRTKQIAASFNAMIYDYIWKNDFSDARNFALSKSNSDWNLVLDADEYLAQGRREDITSFLNNVNQLGAIQIRNAYMDHGEVSYGIDYTTRLIPKNINYIGKVHEQVDSELSRIFLPLSFEHDGYLIPNKAERNLPLLLEELSSNSNDTYYLYQVASTLANMKKYSEAMNYYRLFYKQVETSSNYYKKGTIRYIYNLIELDLFEEALIVIDEVSKDLNKYADFNFMCGIFYMKLVLSDTIKYQGYLSLIEKSYLRCLEIGEVPIHRGIYGCGSFKAAYNLGVWYEVTENKNKAIEYYKFSASLGYEVARKRLISLIR